MGSLRVSGLHAAQLTKDYSGGGRYVGEMKEGKRHGVGTTYYSNGYAEVGRYEMDHPVGEGAWWSADRQTAWRLKDGKKVGGNDLKEAEAVADSLGLPVPLLQKTAPATSAAAPAAASAPGPTDDDAPPNGVASQKLETFEHVKAALAAHDPCCVCVDPPDVWLAPLRKVVREGGLSSAVLRLRLTQGWVLLALDAERVSKVAAKDVWAVVARTIQHDAGDGIYYAMYKGKRLALFKPEAWACLQDVVEKVRAVASRLRPCPTLHVPLTLRPPPSHRR